MKKLCFAFFCLLTVASCDKKYPIDQLPEDTSLPTLTYPLTSFSTANKFVSFGGTLPSSSQSKGYDIFLADTNQYVASACSGIVTSVTADAAGNNAIAVRYKSNSIYSFLYSGLNNVMVAVSDTLNPGTLLGKIGSNREVYFAVIKSNTEVICPQSIGSPNFNNAIQLAIDKHNMFNAADSVFDACLFETLPR